MSAKIEVLLFGLGAIGSFYAFILSKSDDVRLTVVARSNYDAVKANGLTIDSEVYGSHTYKPYKVVKTAAEAGVKYDYVVCAHKAIGQSTVPEQIAPAVDAENTTLVIIQNGVGNEEAFRKAFPKTTILTCVTWVGSLQTSPGVIKHTKSEHTQIGLFSNTGGDKTTEQTRLDTFTSILSNGGTPFDVEPNMQIKRWEKVVWNAAWNSCTTLALVDTQTWLSTPSGMLLTRRIMKEAIDVARQCDAPLEYELADQLIEKILKMPGIYSSMHADRMAGRQMEVEMILGTPVRKARELGLSVPSLDALYALLSALNVSMGSKAKSSGTHVVSDAAAK